MCDSDRLEDSLIFVALLGSLAAVIYLVALPVLAIGGFELGGGTLWLDALVVVAYAAAIAMTAYYVVGILAVPVVAAWLLYEGGKLAARRLREEFGRSPAARAARVERRAEIIRRAAYLGPRRP